MFQCVDVSSPFISYCCTLHFFVLTLFIAPHAFSCLFMFCFHWSSTQFPTCSQILSWFSTLFHMVHMSSVLANFIPTYLCSVSIFFRFCAAHGFSSPQFAYPVCWLYIVVHLQKCSIDYQCVACLDSFFVNSWWTLVCISNRRIEIHEFPIIFVITCNYM